MRLTMMVAASAIALMTACAGRDDRPAPPPATHPPSDAAELVLRVATEGGFVPVEHQLTSVPAFSLYADGTIVRPGLQAQTYPGPALPALAQRTVTPEGIDAIVRAALDAGVDGTTDLGGTGVVGIADATETVFTLRTGDGERTLRVYALAETGSERPATMPPGVYEARQRLAGFVGRLGDLASWLPTGSLPDAEQPYRAPAARVFAGPHPGGGPPQPAIDWPLADPLGSFPSLGGRGGYGCAVVTGEDWTGVVAPAAAEANELTPWRSEGRSFLLRFRPLLPDETADPGC